MKLTESTKSVSGIEVTSGVPLGDGLSRLESYPYDKTLPCSSPSTSTKHGEGRIFFLCERAFFLLSVKNGSC